VRILIVLLFMLSLSGLIGAVSLLPAFVQAVLEKAAADTALAPLKQNEVKIDPKTSEQIARLAKVLAIYNSDLGGKTPYSAIILGVVGGRGSVRITSIALQRVATTSVATVVQGIASTRDALLSYKSRLEASSPGNLVELPVSSLKDNRNIKFTLTLTNNKMP
jgi:hypothetical protein